ncbi:PRC-barrel domain containing protein [Proteobacteria bacterium 005FR1]|nr:PRC-barrel domain containing protein [Proteobacteria bacterium 005FR1]
MLLLQTELRNFTLRAKDGEIGRARDFLFDDERWTVRYMEANTGKWLLGRRVLISPLSIGEPDLNAREIPVDLGTGEIEKAPGVQEDEPISEQFEREYYGYFGYPYYWVGGDVWGLHGYPADLLQEAAYRQQTPKPDDEKKVRRSHLRSMHEIEGYRIHATNGEIGHVADFLIDSSSWAVRYMVIDVRRWLPGPSVLIAPQWIDQVSWHEKEVYVDITKEAIESAPRFKPPVTRDDEVEIFKHFSRDPYWGERWDRAASHWSRDRQAEDKRFRD